MNETEHSFPLPEMELHKLEEVQEELGHRTPLHRLNHRIQDNIWKLAGAALLAGALGGFFYGRARA